MMYSLSLSSDDFNWSHSNWAVCISVPRLCRKSGVGCDGLQVVLWNWKWAMTVIDHDWHLLFAFCSDWLLPDWEAGLGRFYVSDVPRGSLPHFESHFSWRSGPLACLGCRLGVWCFCKANSLLWLSTSDVVSLFGEAIHVDAMWHHYTQFRRWSFRNCDSCSILYN